MSPAPGVNVTSGGSISSSAPSTDIGQWFVTGLTERGPVGSAQLVHSLSEYKTYFGNAVAYGALYNALDVYFREGGVKAYVSRVVGPAAVIATVTLADSTPVSTLKVLANGAGEWGNNLTVVAARPTGTTFTLTFALSGTTVLESPAFEKNSEAVAWALNTPYIRLEDLGGGIPAAKASTALTTGADDHLNVTETQWTNALTPFTKDLGPGQVSAPGHTTSAGATALLASCEATNRIALVDLVDTGTSATLTSATATLRALSTSRFGGAFAPWVIVPGTAPNTVRTVPPSCVVAGIMARNDSAGLNPNDPAAGVNGVSNYAVGLSQAGWLEGTRETLNYAGVNVIRGLLGGFRVYGFRTLVNWVADPTWEFLSNARLDAYIKAKCAAVGERFEFREIGRAVPAEFGSAIEGEVLLPLYNDEALFGDTFGEAAQVDISSVVNTPEKLAAGQLNANVGVVMSAFAEVTNIAISKETQN